MMLQVVVATSLLVALYMYEAIKGRKEDIHAKVLAKVPTEEAKDTGRTDGRDRKGFEKNAMDTRLAKLRRELDKVDKQIEKKLG